MAFNPPMSDPSYPVSMSVTKFSLPIGVTLPTIEASAEISNEQTAVQPEHGLGPWAALNFNGAVCQMFGELIVQDMLGSFEIREVLC